MFAIIYTPTEGDAIQNFSRLFRKPEGCFLNIFDQDRIEDNMAQFGDPEDIDYIVVTDGEEVSPHGSIRFGLEGTDQERFSALAIKVRNYIATSWQSLMDRDRRWRHSDLRCQTRSHHPLCRHSSRSNLASRP